MVLSSSSSSSSSSVLDRKCFCAWTLMSFKVSSFPSLSLFHEMLMTFDRQTPLMMPSKDNESLCTSAQSLHPASNKCDQQSSVWSVLAYPIRPNELTAVSHSRDWSVGKCPKSVMLSWDHNFGTSLLYSLELLHNCWSSCHLLSWWWFCFEPSFLFIRIA